MVNSVLSSLPTYYMSALKLPKKVTQHINCEGGGGAWSYQSVIPKHSLLLKHLSFF